MGGLMYRRLSGEFSILLVVGKDFYTLWTPPHTKICFSISPVSWWLLLLLIFSPKLLLDKMQKHCNIFDSVSFILKISEPLSLRSDYHWNNTRCKSVIGKEYRGLMRPKIVTLSLTKNFNHLIDKFKVKSFHFKFFLLCKKSLL